MKHPRKHDQQEAARLLLGALRPSIRALTLRVMWRMIPINRRSSPLLEPARPFAPRRLKGLPAGGGAR